MPAWHKFLLTLGVIVICLAVAWLVVNLPKRRAKDR